VQASEFGAALRERRLAAGLTQEELAGRAMLSVRTISSLEHGLSRPYLKTVNLLARALGLTEAERDEFLRAARPAAMASAQPPMPDSAAPQQLTADPAGFTGRTAELTTLDAVLDEGAPGQMAIAAISGVAGAGKTALAVHWAHRVTARFPDGRLYVNLRGYDAGQPMAPGDALAGFLRELGVPGQDIPADLEERAAKYRTLLAAKRMLILLDNAGSVQQVRPLLPGAMACAVVVTSRDTLAGLVARDGARRLHLDPMPPDG
jgi:transcriptional regulator with XRE-family HTH domain